MNFLQRLLGGAIALSFLGAAGAQAAENTRCYELGRETMAANDDEGERKELWCYQSLDAEGKTLYIYNADSDEVLPELAMLVDASGMITHASLLAGEVTYHRVRAEDFNPLSIPLTEPKDSSPVPRRSQLDKSARDVLIDLLMRADGGTVDFSVLKAAPSGSASFKPWRGYWWPQKNMPLAGPMGRYDRFVQSRTGSNPGSVAWERSHHDYSGVWWEGHCNGWAASAILRSEPRTSKRDAASGITFSVSDQKGLLAELDYCAKIAFFGRRYRSGGNLKDINPALFHKTVLYYVGNLHKPIAVDYMADTPVDTHVISGYTMTMKSTGVNTYSVTAKMSMHRYDKSITNQPGTAPRYTRTYRYTLKTDTAGNPISGTWISANPDFLWAALSPGRCGSQNPRVTSSWVETIRGL